MSVKYRLLLPISILFACGLIMIFNTTSAEILDSTFSGNTSTQLFKQLISGILGLIGGIISYHIGYKRLLFATPYILWSLIVLLIIVLIPGLGATVNGARRWIHIGGMSIQPSEFVKFIAPAYFIYRFLKMSEQKFDLLDFIKTLAPLSFALFFIALEPNNGTCAVIALTLVVVFFLIDVPTRFWAVPMGVFAILASIFAFQMPYVKARLDSYLHPERDIQGKGHQPYQAKIASGSGGLFGKGPGKSVQKLSYLPEAQNDYIAAIFAEEYGFVGILLLISMYAWLCWAGFSIAISSKEPAACSIAGCFTFLIAFQAFLNLGVVSGLLPSTGLNLPFFSQGGCSLIANAGAVGALLSMEKRVV